MDASQLLVVRTEQAAQNRSVSCGDTLVILEALIWQDVVLSLGATVGLASKLYALADSATVWSRSASVPNAFFYAPSIIAFWTLGLWLSAVTSFISMVIWMGIAWMRAPDGEDWIGRKSGD